MEERINRPKVFLSHSQKNSDFIEKLDSDLRKCQIDTWLFTVDIRHGKSWQDSIFESGIPTCDAVLVYLTEASIQSAVVKKEIDVALIQNLKDNNIAFLPYVDNAKFRTELRPDIQALQVPEWNNENYYILLPRVVAEIWRSYLERKLASAVSNERLRRVEAELELEKYKNQPEEIFTRAETKEFEYIWNSLNQTTPLTLNFERINPETRDYETTSTRFIVHLSTTFAAINDLFQLEYDQNDLAKEITRQAQKLINTEGFFARRKDYYDITDELLTHGLIENYTYTTHSD